MRVWVLLLILSMALVGCGKPNNQYQGYVEGENLYLASPFSGALVKMQVHRGEKVKKDQLLFVLDPNPQAFSIAESQYTIQQAEKTLMDLKKPKRKPEIEAIEAQIEQTKAQISLAEIRVRRNEILYSKHYMDKDTLDGAVEHLHEVQALMAEYKANLDLALLGAREDQIIAESSYIHALVERLKASRWNAEQKNIYAPDDGLIFDTYYRQGEFVSAERPVASLLTHENTRIEFFVPLQDLSGIHVGKKIIFTYENTNKTNEAQITYISPEAEYMPPLVYSRDNSDKIVFRIKAQVSKNDRLIPGEPVIVIIEPDHA